MKTSANSSPPDVNSFIEFVVWSTVLLKSSNLPWSLPIFITPPIAAAIVNNGPAAILTNLPKVLKASPAPKITFLNLGNLSAFCAANFPKFINALTTVPIAPADKNTFAALPNSLKPLTKPTRPFVKSITPSKTLLINGRKPSPSCCKKTLNVDLTWLTFCATVSNLVSASLFKAFCSTASFLAKDNASAKPSELFAKDKRERAVLTLLRPSSVRTGVTDSPAAEIPLSPSRKACAADATSSSASCLNSATDIPAVVAKVSNLSPPNFAASDKFIKNFPNAVEPAAAWTPVSLVAAENANMSSADKPAIVPVAPKFCANNIISDSFAATLLPSSTKTEPNFPTVSVVWFVTFKNLARDVAACVPVKLVATDNLPVTSTNCATSSALTPNCPATEANCANSADLTGICVANVCKSLAISLKTIGSSTSAIVFFTNANESSNSIAALAPAVKPTATPAITPTAATLTTEFKGPAIPLLTSFAILVVPAAIFLTALLKSASTSITTWPSAIRHT